MTANPRSHTPRLRAWVSRLSRSVVSSGASSTPIRCRMLVRALARALNVASR